MAGKLYRAGIYQVSCVDCGDGEALYEQTSYADAERTLRAYGWKKQKLGWACGRCIERNKLAKEERDV